MSRVDEPFALLRVLGSARYGGERVNQLEHALQCAWLAERDGAPAALITAALFHDIGHLVHCLFGEPLGESPDHRHETLGQRYLERWFGDAVLAPVALHVEAKRFLCAVEPAYADRLSPASTHSLRMQGGVLSPAEVEAFRAKPYAEDAVRLRRWDERAKTPAAETPDLDHFRPYAESRVVGAGRGDPPEATA